MKGETLKLIRYLHPNKRNYPKFFYIPRYLQYETTDFNSMGDQINIKRIQNLNGMKLNYCAKYNR